MTRNRFVMRRVATTLIVAGIIVSQAAYAQVTLNFVNADIDQVAKAIGAATGKTIIVDPRVKGQLNLVSERSVPEDQALKTLQSALRMQGFALVQDHGVLKVVPEADAKLQGVPTYIGNAPRARGDQVITQVFELHNESANNLLPVLRPLISPNNTVTAYPANNTIVVTDYADNVRRIAQIIAGVDSAAGAQVQVIPLRNANAIDLAAQLQKMLDPGAIGNSDATLKVSVTADPRTNSLMLRASSASRLAAAKRIVQQLDAPSGVPGNMHVVPLRNADAVKLAKTLRGMLGKGGNDSGSSASSNDANSFNQSGGSSASGNFSTGTSGTPPLPSGGLGGGSSSSSAYGSGSSGSGGVGSGGLLGGDKDKSDDNQPGGMIQADAATNSLIITASDPVYRNLRSVIDQLDARRAQVYIEALIVELNSTTQGNLGIQWQVASGQFLGGTNLAPTAGTGLGNSIVNLTSGGTAATTGLAANLAGLSQGLNIGWLHNMFGVQGLGALLQYFAGVSDANVLSTPNLITLDNEEAKIVVGQNVPIATGSYSNLTSGTTSNAFNTYDRRDVGLTLHVKPQITDGGILKLQLYTEDSAVVSGTTNAQTGPTFTKRSIQSTILADNGEIIVLGGLMQDNYQVSNSKVPLLGDIPWIGQLFRSESKQRQKTNLMVFLRPVIISDRSTAQEVTANRYDYIQGVTGAYKSDNNVIRDKDDPVVPPMPLGPSQGGTPAGNLFDLDKMRRQQLQRQVAPVPAQPLPEATPAQPQGVPQQSVPQQPLTATPGASQ
ncbi:type II secretion system protein GspD [Burkholderia ambifaria]|uniref:General secretion pathway protein D n=1 Tax=Burkholderia ambifaria (strain ATCC BAA-244 / DSM 16087 / CCUG 44356 / LMG 19182 / AMMD) TaxID=339670 RepID=Q0BJR0_BURCM|nr:type II secretion system secretin GspD [Burkholderia ambifaria]ABI85613.1 general secretion pathway protein D [Burkholderia ambifaria AMMD]MBR7934055.1 type II secretion system secretin GspD [Burkholderia ambifaria]PEH67043.1 type II secretion system protein GspD [Burkholderia ambifaria]QQC04016.1 type II secretion system secretin GspD [Burkholderia ambifaria]UZU05214.1 type II secretion system secretin GspD [Burkholderia ambifaria]